MGYRRITRRTFFFIILFFCMVFVLPVLSPRSHAAEAARKTVSFKLSRSSIAVKKKKSKTLKAKSLRGARKISWSVTDTNVVKLRKSKRSVKITGRQDGIAAVIAKAGNVRLVCRVTVGKGTRITAVTMTALGLVTPPPAFITQSSAKPVYAVTLNSYYESIELGTGTVLKAAYYPADTDESTVQYWSSSDPGVASVSDGIVTGTGCGKATVRVRIGSATASCEVEVTEKHKQAEVLEFGHTFYTSLNSNYYMVNYAAKIRNPNSTYELMSPGVDITIQGVSGNILKTDYSLMNHLAPGDTSYVVGTAYVEKSSGQIGEVTFSNHILSDWDFFDRDDSRYLNSNNYLISQSSEIPGMNEYKYTGRVSRTATARDLYTPSAAVLFRKNGVLIGGGTCVLGSDGQGAFEISVDKDQIDAMGAGYAYSFAVIN